MCWTLLTDCWIIILKLKNCWFNSSNIIVLKVINIQIYSDSNKYIKGVAYRILARFIAAIEKDKIEPKLIENYLKMTDSDIRELLPD